MQTNDRDVNHKMNCAKIPGSLNDIEGVSFWFKGDQKVWASLLIFSTNGEVIYRKFYPEQEWRQVTIPINEQSWEGPFREFFESGRGEIDHIQIRYSAENSSLWIDGIEFARKATTAETPDVPGALVNVHLGMTDYARTLNLDVPRPQGFLIAFPDAHNIVIAGEPIDAPYVDTPALVNPNIRDGVSWFLKNTFGVRWLLPGDLGDYVPRRDDITVPMVQIRKTPSFLYRNLGGFHQVYASSRDNRAPRRWACRAGNMALGLSFSHNIGNTIPPEKYAATRPEFFQLIDGTRNIPAGATDENQRPYNWRLKHWEPCYSAPGLADVAVEHIDAFFAAKPLCNTYSLGTNDWAEVCECGRCRAKNQGRPAGLGAQPYFEWMNDVVGRVRQRYPHKVFGFLAYHLTSLPPRGTGLNDHVVPVLTWDFRYFADPKGKGELENIVEEWTEAVPTFGWWNYTFEGSYLVPPFYAHLMADELARLHRDGLRYYYDELHPGLYYKNAPQSYLLFELLRDISQDPDAILNDWYEKAVGREAAPYLAAYFAVWENFWVNKAVQTAWFQKRMDFVDPEPFLQRTECGYLAALDEDDVRRAEQAITKAVSLAQTDEQKARANFFADPFLMAKKTYYLPWLTNNRMLAQRRTITPLATVFTDDFSEPRPGKNPQHQGWSLWRSRLGKYTFSVDGKNGHDEPGSLSVHCESWRPTACYAFQKFFPFSAFEAGKSYKVSVWCRMNRDVVGKIRLVAKLKTDDGQFLGRVHGSKGQFHLESRDESFAGGQWQQLCFYFTVPQAWKDEISEMLCQVIVQNEAAKEGCRLWLDDFAVTEVPHVGIGNHMMEQQQ
jgi:hypothetical protein